MKRKAVMIAGALMVSAFALQAADPGGHPGLVQATFPQYDSSASILDHAEGYTLYPDMLYSAKLPERTTVGYRGYMKMDEGVTYTFKARCDDRAWVTIDGATIASQSERTFTPSATDWYLVEFRVSNNSGPGGATSGSNVGILWKRGNEVDWRKIYDDGTGELFKTGESSLGQIITPTYVSVLSTQMRPDDLTIMDIVYFCSSANETVNVRALAFQDGQRSFAKVIKPKSFVQDPHGNPTIDNIGDGVPANVVHNLSWRVPDDWDGDLTKIMFEILVSDQAQLPLKMIKIPATAHYPELTVACNAQTDADMFNACLWYYACEDPYLVNDGSLCNTNGVRMVYGTSLDNRMELNRWMYEKMGWEPVYGGPLLTFIQYATRQEFWFNSNTQNCYIRKGAMPASLYIGEKAYCVIDLSGGAEAASYPITYLDTAPLAGWSDEYKTTKLVLRRIKEGQFMMQKNKQVTLTKPYYIGVYPVTKKQYDMVMGTANANGTNDKEPMVISWNDVRGDSATYNWPTVTTLDEAKFLGKLRSKTGFSIDLPTEAQWEYACRAGTSSSFSNGGNNDTDLGIVGKANGGSDIVDVGQYVPNLWGIYDMHGNVGEWCLDWHSTLTTEAAIDPVGAGSGTVRVFRGNGFNYYKKYYADSFSRRDCGNPASSMASVDHTNSCIGFRLLFPIAE